MKIAKALTIFILLIIGIFVLWHSPGDNLTAFVVYGPGGDFNITFIFPTPGHDAVVNAQNLTVKINAELALSTAILEWNGVNETMSGSGQIWELTKSVSGQVNYKVYAISANLSAFSETRTVTSSYISLSAINSVTADEDTTLSPINLSAYVTSSQPVQFSFSLDVDTILSCSILNEILSCTPLPNASGITTIIVTADDTLVTDSTSFPITLFPINDMPYIKNAIGDEKFTLNQKIKIKLSQYFDDVDSSLNYSLAVYDINSTAKDDDFKFNLTNDELFITPKQIGPYNLTITATDNSGSVVQTLLLNVTPNNPPTLTSRSPDIFMITDEIKSIDLDLYFSDPDNDQLTFSTPGVANIHSPINDEVLFLNPDQGFNGVSDLTVTASDGMDITDLVLHITVGTAAEIPPANETSEENSSEEQSEPEEIPPSPAPVLTWNEDTSGIIEITSFIDLSFSDQIEVVVTGLSHIAYTFDYPLITFNPEPNWFGTEEAVIVVTETNKTQTITMPLSVVNVDDPPELIKEFPDFQFNEDNTEITINLAEYYIDPDGDELEFEVIGTDQINVSLSQSIVIFSLAGDVERGDQTLMIYAKDKDGNMREDPIVVTIAEAIRQDSAWIIVIFQILAIALLILVGYFGYDRYFHRKPANRQPLRITRKVEFDEKDNLHLLLKDLPGQDEQEESLPKESQQEPSQTSQEHQKEIPKQEQQEIPQEEKQPASPKSFNNFNILSGLKEAYKKYTEKPHEPRSMRMEALYIKESVSALRAIISSTDDGLIRAALNKEKGTLSKAYHTMLGKEQLSRNQMRKLLLYVKEAQASLKQIIDMNEDNLLAKEIEREVDRLKVVESHLEFKLTQL